MDLKRHIAQSLKSIFHAVEKATSDGTLVESLHDVYLWDDKVLESVYSGVADDAGGAQSFETAYHQAVCSSGTSCKCTEVSNEARRFFRDCMMHSAHSLLTDSTALQERSDEARSRLKKLYYGAYKAALSHARDAHDAPVLEGLAQPVPQMPDKFIYDGDLFKSIDIDDDPNPRTARALPVDARPPSRRSSLPTRRLRGPDSRPLTELKTVRVKV